MIIGVVLHFKWYKYYQYKFNVLVISTNGINYYYSCFYKET